MGAVKKITTPEELDLASVQPAVSVDPARPHLHSAFGREMNGKGYLVGTDGHRLLARVSDAWQKHARPDAPRCDVVIPWDAVRLGEIEAKCLDDARGLLVSSRARATLEVTPQGQRVFYSVKSARKAPDMKPFGDQGVRVDWFKLDQLRHDFAIELSYLLDAVDFFGFGLLTVWAPVYKKFPGEAPIVLTRGAAATLAEAGDMALVMPRRL